MKEKKYFCDWVDDNQQKFTSIAVVIGLVLIIAGLILYTSFKNSYEEKYFDETNAYSSAVYDYLNSVVDTVVIEGRGLDTALIPDDVVYYHTVSDSSDELILKVESTSTKSMQFAPVPSVTARLTKDYQIIEKKPNYTSGKEYAKDAQKNINNAVNNNTMSILLTVVGVVFLIYFSAIFTPNLISRNNKKKNHKDLS